MVDAISLGVLTGAVPRDVVDDAIAVCGRGARRRGGTLPPHVMVYFAMALALYADDDYEEVMVRLSETLSGWDCWSGDWALPTTGGITQARMRLGAEPMAEIFSRVAVPVADPLTQGAWLGSRRLMAIDGFEWDAPDTPENVAEFGYSGSGANASAYPKVRVVTVSECGSQSMIAASIGSAGEGEHTLARRLWHDLDPDWLLIADRGFYSFTNWSTASATGAQLLWRVSASVTLPVLAALPDGSYTSVLVKPGIRGKARAALIERARIGGDLDPDRAVRIRVVEYTVPDRDGNGSGELIALITTITDPRSASAPALAEGYHQRWEHETSNDQLKTHLRGPGRILRSKKPETVRQEIYGYLLTHYAISSLICRAATEAQIDPDRVKFVRAVRIIRRRVTDSPAFPP